MPRNDADDLLQSPGGDDQKIVGYIVLAGAGILLACIALPGLILAAILYWAAVFWIQRNWILYALLPLEFVGLLILHGTQEWLSILGFLSWLRLPYITALAEEYLNKSQPFPITGFSFLSATTFAILMVNIAHPFIDYYRKKIIKSRHDELKKKRKEREYKNFRVKRLKYLSKEQLKFRKSPSQANFIGYDEFGNRVELKDYEANQHVLVVMTTGSGKTVIIGTMVENALRQDKPVFFMDGKGERQSMLQFKELAESYGKKVHLFTDVDELNFNFLRHGSPTQLRDKIMNLFEWSEPFYKLNCSRFLQLAIRMVTDLGETLDLRKLYNLTFQSKAAAFLSEQHEKAGQEYEEILNLWDEYEDARTKKATAQTRELHLGSRTIEIPQEDPMPAEAAPVSATSLFAGMEPEPSHPVSAASLFAGLEPEPVKPPEMEELEPPGLRGENFVAANVEPVAEAATTLEENTDVPMPELTREEAEANYKRIKEKIEYYRERFFGENEDDEDAFNFGTLTSLRNQIGELIESDLGHLFEETGSGMDLLQVADNNEVAIFSLSGNKYRDYIKMLGRIVISEFNTIVDYRQKVGKKPMLMVCDEFSAYASHEVVDVVNKSRSAGGECVISVQGLSDMDAVDPVMTRQIVNNCNTYFFGRVNDSADAETLAATLGTYEDGDITKQIEKKEFKLRFEAQMGTVRTVQRFRAHPDEIKSLSTGEVFLARKTIEGEAGGTYVARVYVRNALDLTGITSNGC